MAEEAPHPNIGIVDFIEKYEEFIQPSLKEGNLDGTRFLIKECCMRFGLGGIDSRMKSHAYARYRMALTYLNGLADAENPSQGILDNVVTHIDRHVAELGLFLRDDPYYKKMRGIEE